MDFSATEEGHSADRQEQPTDEDYSSSAVSVPDQEPGQEPALQPVAASLAVSSESRRSWGPLPGLAVAGLIVVSFLLRAIWLDLPPGSLIFDEKYYVSAARTILDLPQPPDGAYVSSKAGIDPNTEHPPLAKLIIAGDMSILGDNGWGFRWPSVVVGTLSIAFMFQLARWAGLANWAAVLAAFIYAFDNMVFVNSRTGLLDIFMMLGMLAGATWYLARRPVLAGLAFAFGALCKEYGVYGPAILVTFSVVLTIMQRPERREVARRALRAVVMGIVFAVTFLVVLWALDRHWTEYKTPFAHLVHIWQYGTTLTHPLGPTGIESWPWQWLVDEVQPPYLKVTVTVCKISSSDNAPCPTDDILRVFDTVLFRGALNPYLIFMAPLAAGYVLMMLRQRGDRTALLAALWFVISYLPFIPAAVIDHRISYIYYMFPVIPSLVIASAQLFSDPRIPRVLTGAYIVAILWGFGAYFPFIGFHT